MSSVTSEATKSCSTIKPCGQSTFYSLLPDDAVAKSFSVMQGLGIGLVIIIISWQLFKTFGLPIGIEAENPVQIAWKSALSLFCIIFARPIFDIGFSVINGGGGGGPLAAINELESEVSIQKIFSLSDFSSALDSLASTLAFTFSSGVATVMMVVAGVMIVIILFNLIKMLLELLERYCILGVLSLTAPLGFSAMCSSATSNVFRAWVRMCVGQYIMLLLNIWCIRLFLIMASNGMNADNFIIWMFFLLAFSKVSQKMDTYLQRLGLEVGSTGSSLLGELLAVRSVAGGFSKGAASTMGGQVAQGGLMARGVALGASALNLTGTATAAAQGWRASFNENLGKQVASGATVTNQTKAMAAMMGVSGAVAPAVTQFGRNIASNNLVSKGIASAKYSGIRSQLDSFGEAKGVGQAVDINTSNPFSNGVSRGVASKMMNDTNRIYRGDDCVQAGQAIFGDSIGSYNLSKDNNGGATVENARMGNGAFKFDNPSTGESVTVMKSNQVPQQLKNNASSMYKHGEYSVITQPMHSSNAGGGNGFGQPSGNPSNAGGESGAVNSSSTSSNSPNVNATKGPDLHQSTSASVENNQHQQNDLQKSPSEVQVKNNAFTQNDNVLDSSKPAMSHNNTSPLSRG